MRLLLASVVGLGVPLAGCSQYELAQFASVAAPVATYSALSGYAIDSAFEDFDNAGGGSSSSGGSSQPDLSPETQRISVGDCNVPGATVCQ